LQGFFSKAKNSVSLFRVSAVYPAWASPAFLTFFPFNEINNLCAFNVAFSSIPSAPPIGQKYITPYRTRIPLILRCCFALAAVEGMRLRDRETSTARLCMVTLVTGC